MSTKKKFNPAKKDLIIFDLDGTLTETKSDMQPDMVRALGALLREKKVAVIGGASRAQFERQFIRLLRIPKSLLANLYLFPTTATSFYRYEHGRWRRVYVRALLPKQKKRIRAAFRAVLEKIDYTSPKKIYGKLIEDKGSELTYSFLGQDVVARLGEKGVRLKEAWTRENAKFKMRVTRLVQRALPDLEVRAAGFTSIDVTKKGIDKAYGIREIRKILKMPIKKMLFIGDALYAGGNDHAAIRTGIDCIAVKGPMETKKIIKQILDIGY